MKHHKRSMVAKRRKPKSYPLRIRVMMRTMFGADAKCWDIEMTQRQIKHMQRDLYEACGVPKDMMVPTSREDLIEATNYGFMSVPAIVVKNVGVDMEAY